MRSIFILLTMISTSVEAVTWTVSNETIKDNTVITDNSQRVHNGNTQGTVTINKDQMYYYNQNCTQHCIVYMIESPKIQYIRK